MIGPLRDFPFALRPMIAAHRGDTILGAPENSLDAIAAAVISGADMIEIDVQWTLDEVFVCHHDEKIERKDGPAMNVHTHTYQELDTAMRATTGVRGLTRLDQVLEITVGRIYLNLEIKEYSDRDPKLFMEALERMMIEVKMEERILFSSFRIEYLANASWHIPSVIIQPTNSMQVFFAKRTQEPIVLPKPVEELLPSELIHLSHATSYACELRELTDWRLADIRKRNILISIYTITTDDEFEQAISLGAKALVCEDPQHFAKLRDNRFPELPPLK